MVAMIPHHQAIVREQPPVSEFVEYPKMMTHPAYQPASVGVEITSQHGFKHFVGGKSARFAPMLVHNSEDEEYYASRGYVSQGKSSGAAFARAAAAMQGGAVPHGYVPQEYPKWVAGKLCNNAEEAAAAEMSLQPAPAPVQNGHVDQSVLTDIDADRGREVLPVKDRHDLGEASEIASLKAINADLEEENRALKADVSEIKGQMAEMMAMMKSLASGAAASQPQPSPAPVQAVLQDPVAMSVAAAAAGHAEPVLTRQQKAALTKKRRAAERAAQEAG
jgi:hypothetical protein